MATINELSVKIPAQLEKAVPDAVARLAYLFPAIEFRIEGAEITCGSNEPIDAESIRMEVNYAVYRSHIRASGAGLRKSLFAAVFQN